jgi:pyruvate dehydrogenase E2 component (dihydrolipoamide acetyltransferase)
MWEIVDLALPGDRRLRARIRPGTGAPLVFLHGLFDDSLGWTSLAQMIDRPCVALDLPGFGGSDLPTRPRVGAYGEDVARALVALSLEGCTLVGHSLGGAVAADAAERASAAAALVLLAPVGFGRIRLAEVAARPGVIDVLELAVGPALRNPILASAAYAAFVTRRQLPSSEQLQRLRSCASRGAAGARAAVTAIATAGREGTVRHFRGPVAALWGGDDLLVPPNHRRALLQELPQAHVEIWPRMGHHRQREALGRLAEFVLAEPAGPAPAKARQRLRAA